MPVRVVSASRVRVVAPTEAAVIVRVSDEPLRTLSTFAVLEFVRIVPVVPAASSSTIVTLPVWAVKSSFTAVTVMVSVEVVVLPLSSVTV